MTYPPPPPFQPVPDEQPSPAAWLIPSAGVLALIGVFTPWFNPQGVFRGRVALQAESALYSWKDGKIGLVAPILLVLLGIGVAGLLLGRRVNRFHSSSHGPVVAAGRGALIAGAVSLAATAIAWFLVPSQYDNIPSDAGGSWDGAERLGIEMSRGPQLGYWLTIGAAVLAIVGGALMLALRSAPAAPVPAGPGFKPPTGPPLPGYPPAPDQQWQQGQFQPPPAYQPPPPTQPPAYQPQAHQPPQFTRDDGTPPIQH